jgi:ADP-ribose pyrophosphatase YjhB (NUDIX family)
MRHQLVARGVLKKDNKILFVEYNDESGQHFALPGGAQEIGESLAEAVVREFKEETTLDVKVNELLMIREFILTKSETKSWEKGVHQVEAIFLCDFIDADQKEKIGDVPDYGMLSLKWMDVNELGNYRVYPTKDLAEILEKKNVSYLFTRS